MSKRYIAVVLSVMCLGLLSPGPAPCEEMSAAEIMEELRALKARIGNLEEELSKKDQEIEQLKIQAVKRDEMPAVIEEMKSGEGPLATIQDHIHISGLLEVGGAYESVNQRAGNDVDQSDLSLTTVELTVEAEVNEWVSAATTLLFEDATFDGESGLDVDMATVTIGNTERFPLYVTGGALYVPFGALLTHFPDDPLIDDPLTLSLGETREKAAILGVEYGGFALSGYAFNGDMEEAGEENHVDSFGFDANYTYEGKQGLVALLGASYISNIAESDGLTDALTETLGVNAIQDRVGGFDAYLHLDFANFFFAAEYMTALEDFAPAELATGAGIGARPSVWNLELGYNWDWGRNLEIALKYAGSDESEGLGFPEDRYGLALNQTIWEGVTASLAFLHDEYEAADADNRDDRNVVYGQVAVEF